jgi:outer membrane protein TolC
VNERHEAWPGLEAGRAPAPASIRGSDPAATPIPVSGAIRAARPAALAAWVLAAVLVALPGSVPWQSSTAQAAGGLDALVREGLSANRSLQQERLALDGSDAEVREAARQYLPSVTFNARLSDRSGNVTDLGSLMNPAFGALNQLLGERAFPTDIALKLPSRQETSLRLTQPLVEPRIAAAWRIRSGARDVQRGAVQAARRRLAADIRIGYLQHARALRLVELYDSTLVLVDEVVRVEESLLRNGAATPDQVLRARADRSETEQKEREAQRLADASRQSLNALLGRPIDARLDPIADDELGLDLTVPLDSALVHAGLSRPELAQARGGERVARGELALANAGYVPSVVGVLDWGVQGEKYRFNQDEDYLVASLVMQWTLFDGGQREARRQQAHAEVERARTAERDAAELVALDVRTAWEAASVARDALAGARERHAAARRTYELVVRRHANGAASFLELLDARTNFTNAGLNRLFSTYDYWQRCAELDAAAALYPEPSMIEGDRP